MNTHDINTGRYRKGNSGTCAFDSVFHRKSQRPSDERFAGCAQELSLIHISQQGVTATPAHAYLGFGSNLGERRENIAKGLAMLRESGKIEITKVSSLYETEPVGYKEQGLFLNAVAPVSYTHLDVYKRQVLR